MKKLCQILVAVVLAAASTMTVANDKPFLWRIEGERSSYLFGTIHVSDPQVTTLSTVVEQAFQNSDAVYTEIPMDMQTQFAAVQGMILPGGKTLPEILPVDVIARANSYLGNIMPGMSLDAMGQLKVWAIALTLPLLESQLKNLGAEPLDMALYNRAVAEGKEAGGLETADEQISIMDRMSAAEQERLLTDTLDYLDDAKQRGVDIMDEMAAEYLKGDLEGLGRLMTKYLDITDPFYDKLMDSLLIARNQLMAERVDVMLNANPGKSFFVAVGAGHFWGEQGVQKLLRGKGYSVTRVQ
ncbi:MAG: TraB/GumN family protein [Gammaproteobacteria bacterium]|nr:TraB/GumN family protein [Gammaproteobacteria bacterium]